MNNLSSILKPFLVPILIVTCVSCNTTNYRRLDTIVPPQQVADFSGDWEKNYQQSDDFEIEFRQFISKIQRKIEKLQKNRKRDSLNVGTVVIPSMESISGLARFAEEITRMPLVHIEQDQSSVRIGQGEDFSLQCKFFEQNIANKENSFGIENCSWNSEQLFFQIKLQNGLSIYHQVTLAPDAQELNITTTINSKEVASPLTIRNYYYKYISPDNDFECDLTLTRNNVCRRKSD